MSIVPVYIHVCLCFYTDLNINLYSMLHVHIICIVSIQGFHVNSTVYIDVGVLVYRRNHMFV